MAHTANASSGRSAPTGPLAVQARAKQPFTLPVAAFMAKGSELWRVHDGRRVVTEALQLGILDGAVLRNVIAQHASGADNPRLPRGLTVLELSLP